MSTTTIKVLGRITAFLLFHLFILLPLSAQPSWTKKATKAVFTLKTFTEEGGLKASATGFFIGQQGEAIAPCQPFRGAVRAVVIDADGREWPVECMLGANETYDVAKFRVAAKKISGLTVATTTQQGVPVWQLPYREMKKIPQGTVRKVEKFNTLYDYYTVALMMPASTEGSPLLNAQGEVIGMMQTPLRVADTLSYAVSARFADSLRVTGLSINDAVLRSIGIKKALPSDLSQAQLALYLGTTSLDSVVYAQLVDDFIGQFPDVSDGYQSRASLLVSANNFAAAQQDMELAIKKAVQKDEAHYGYSRLIYQKILLKPDVPYEPWTFDLALSEAETAYQINPQPVYRYQQALVHFAQKNYRQALDCYMSLTNTPMRSADLFYEASRCQALLGDTTAQLALVDSAVAQFNRPYLKEAAPYLLLRAQTRLSVGRYREAVSDLNEYERLMRSQLTANFYYLRHQADVGGRLFQQALDDIDRAIELALDNDFYLAEKAALQIRVGLYAEAKETAASIVSMAPAQSDGYLFLGLAQCLSNQKAEGLKNLEKARDMGDAQAAGLIEKYAR